MVGIVLVSHSQKLAEGVRDLAAQMTQGRVKIAVAGGIDDEEHPIGTDPIRVMTAISEVYSADGVVILMDLGSALMSAETALDLLDPEWRPHLHLCAAPFAEGAVTAAVQASVGGSAESVMAAAEGALLAKRQHLGMAEDAAPSAAASHAANGAGQRISITIPNKLGIHARPAARIVALTGQHEARLTIRKDGRGIDGRNINEVMLLDARQGDAVEFIADGAGAAALLAALQALAGENFGDDDSAAVASVSPPAQSASPADSVLAGVAAAKGIAIGRVHLLSAQTPAIDSTLKRPVEDEKFALMMAAKRAIDALQEARRSANRRGEFTQADIFQAHLYILDDERLVTSVFDAIEREQVSAAAAWWAAVEALAAQYRASANPILQGRAADVLDVGQRVLAELLPGSARSLALTEPCVVVAEDLAPSETSQLDPQNVLAIVTQQGGATSHTAIIARGMGIPAVVGLGAGFASLTHGQQVVVDGGRGWVYAAPTAAQIAEFEAQIATERASRAALLTKVRDDAKTRDGRRIEVAANVGGVADATRLREMGAEGVGLFRTELLFMGRSSAPTEDEQVAAYHAVAQALEGRPVIIRTLDVGGDKAISYINIPPEENPFLGYRGIRYWLGDRPLARAQMRAIYRTSTQHNIRVMFPMVGTLEELDTIHAFLDEIRAELDAEGRPYDRNIQVGIMIEVPSAVLCAAQLAARVDFFSIGTNDLTQYLMAADRGNARVTPLATPFQPAVLRAIQQVVDAAHACGKWVGICGEMAGNPLLTRVLIGLGVDELSMSAPSIAEVKRIIRETSYTDAQALAREVLALPTAREVEARLKT
jgi:multiphosphoryl transfer protein